MPASLFWTAIRNGKKPLGPGGRRRLIKVLGIVFLFFILIGIEIGPFSLFQQAKAVAFQHTSPTVESTCNQAFYSPDGNPFQLCPGPYPGGGNCVWWAWEQWHLLGYDLPPNWGNAADWVVDAERYALPLGTTPRVGSIAVFPRGDGVWAYSSLGHVAFVTWVSPDGNTFNVTYQNYGDPTPMYIGRGYSVSAINEARFQNGEMRFIYFPKPLDPNRFARLPGVDGNDFSAILYANSMLSGSLLTLGASSELEFNADFTGNGLNDLLLYNRQQGRLDVLVLSSKQQPASANGPHTVLTPQRVSLSDATTSVNGWGPNLDIHIGDFNGSGHSEILLYDRVTGTLQLLSLTPRLQIQQHVTLKGWGPGWELYVGSFEGQRSGVFMYNRFATNPPSSGTPNSVSHPKPTPKPARVSKPTPTPTPKPGPSPSPTPSPTPTPKSEPTPTPTPKHDPDGSQSDLASHQNSGLDSFGLTTNPTPPIWLSGTTLSAWAKQGRTANILLLDFNADFSMRHVQPYSLWHNAWEVYVGRFINPSQDGIFLYDRTMGEARTVSFDANLKIADYQEMHNLQGNWEIHTGDFNGSKHSQVLMYDPTDGNAQILTFAKDLSLSAQKTYSGWGKNQVLYVGHFGLSTLSIMLYDPHAGQSTFKAFNSSLKIAHTYTVRSWNQNWQILIGAFVDRSRCLINRTCATGDDILALNRKTGQMQQFTFSFEPPVKLRDNRVLAIMGNGGQEAGSLNAVVNAPAFSLLATLQTTIRMEELY